MHIFRGIQIILILALPVYLLRNKQNKEIIEDEIPIQVINGVPYLSIDLLCSAKVNYQNNNSSQMQKNRINQIQQKLISQSDSYLQKINYLHLFKSTSVLLDTGSSELWLADRSCSNCHETTSICPHISKTQKTFSYVKGQVKGTDIYTNVCGQRVKIMCVKEAEGISSMKGGGVTGLRGEGNGLRVIFGALQSKEDDEDNQQNKIESIQFSLGEFRNTIKIKIVKQNKMRHSEISFNQFSSNVTKIKSNKNWQIFLKRLYFFNKTIDLQIQSEVSIDTGSTKIIFPIRKCEELISELDQKVGISCRYYQDGIYCNKNISSLHMNLVFQSSSIGINELVIQNNQLINSYTNKINIICRPQNYIVFGYPLFRSFMTQFLIQTNMNQKSYYILFEPSNENKQIYKRNVKIIVFIYFVLVIVTAFCVISIINYIKDKRSKSIII